MTVHLPDELQERLAEEAARQGKSVDSLVAEMVAKQLPPAPPAEMTEGEDARPPRRLSFIGVGASGGTENVAERHREIIREHFANKTASDV